MITTYLTSTSHFRHAENLQQLDNGIKIPPSGWKCEKCDKTDNLWLNLTDGSILCGRKFWDGSGGNNHAVEHYAQVKYPLAVKLGTITADGADVHSYDEDDMVEDPHLAKHLAHFGINIAQLQKVGRNCTWWHFAIWLEAFVIRGPFDLVYELVIEIVKIFCCNLYFLVIKSCHNFARVTTAQLSWHMQIVIWMFLET